jgi:hypothetical protein
MMALLSPSPTTEPNRWIKKVTISYDVSCIQNIFSSFISLPVKLSISDLLSPNYSSSPFVKKKLFIFSQITTIYFFSLSLFTLKLLLSYEIEF